MQILVSLNKGVVLGSRDSNWYSGHYGGDPQCTGTITSAALRTFNLPPGTVFAEHPYATMAVVSYLAVAWGH